MIGETIKHYKVEAQIGRGGMGVVYRARDERLGRAVALKFLTRELTANPDRRARFLLEARAACAVNHPAIAQVYDVDESEHGVFIAMELVEGKTVRALLQGRELDLLGALEVAIQVTGGLAKAHEAGIVHRDIKPENVVVTPDGHAKILDFGLAKLLEPSKDGVSSSGDALSHMETLAKSHPGMVLGTLRYMSPEQARGLPVDHRSDVFSLGVLIYEMTTGHLPFSGATPLDTLHAIAFEETRPVTAVRPNLPPSLQRVVGRCLRKQAKDRYSGARELLADLRAVQKEVESGVSGGAGWGARLVEPLRALRAMAPSEWAVPAVAVVLVFAVAFAMGRGASTPGLIFFAVVALLVYRRIRNRRRRLLRRFVGRVRKVDEVEVVACEGLRITIVAERAVASTYVRVNAALDAVNSSMFFGEPFTVAVREDLTPDQVKELLRAPGVVYVREQRTSGRREVEPPATQPPAAHGGAA